jgi:hypothetical protein
MTWLDSTPLDLCTVSATLGERISLVSLSFFRIAVFTDVSFSALLACEEKSYSSNRYVFLRVKSLLKVLRCVPHHIHFLIQYLKIDLTILTDPTQKNSALLPSIFALLTKVKTDRRIDNVHRFALPVLRCSSQKRSLKRIAGRTGVEALRMRFLSWKLDMKEGV